MGGGSLMNDFDKINFSAFQFNESVCETVEQIGAPLLINFGITHFGCIKILNNGLMLRLSNIPQWTKKYFEFQLYNDPHIFNLEKVPKEGDVYVSFLTGDPVGDHNHASCLEYDIWNTLLIYEKLKDHGYMWFFATTRSNYQIIDFYINNLNIFKHFILYFKERASDLLDVKDRSKFIIPNIKSFDYAVHAPYIQQEQVTRFFEQTKITKYFGREKLKNVYLSNREFELLKNIASGKTAKESARIFRIAPRTVEKHIEKIKIKTDIHTKSQLIDIFFKEFL